MELPIQARDCFCHDLALRAGGQAVGVSGDNVSGDTDLILHAPLPTDPPILLFLADLTQKAKLARWNGNNAAFIPDFAGIFPSRQAGGAEGAGRISKPL
jgi:hypothetical protein